MAFQQRTVSLWRQHDFPIARLGCAVLGSPPLLEDPGHGPFTMDRRIYYCWASDALACPTALLPARHMKQQLRVLVIGLAIFALYLPVALFVGGRYVPVPRPPGVAVETPLKIAHHAGFQYHTHSMVMATHANDGTVILYEDLTPLGPAKFIKFTDDPRNFVVFSASDNSDPRTNGRRYWLVLP